MKIGRNFLTILLSAILVLSVILYFTTQAQAQAQAQAYHIPKIIWQFWDKDPPLMIQQMKGYNTKRLEGWDIRFLNATTIKEYIPDSVLPPTFDKFLPQHKADWYRLYLLKNHGGCWMDASIIINEKGSIDKIRDDSYARKSELTAFQAKTPLNIENWFIMAPENSPVIVLWFNEYNGAVTNGMAEYKKFIIEDGVNWGLGRENSNPVEVEDTYFTQHYALQRILQKNLHKNAPIYILESKDTMHKFFYDCNKNEWTDEQKKACFASKLKDHAGMRQLPYIKLSQHERKLNVDLTEYFADK